VLDRGDDSVEFSEALPATGKTIVALPQFRAWFIEFRTVL